MEISCTGIRIDGECILVSQLFHYIVFDNVTLPLLEWESGDCCYRADSAWLLPGQDAQN